MKYFFVFSVSILLSLKSFAAMDMFLKINLIPGESVDATHKEWIDVLAFTDGATAKIVPNSSPTVFTNEFSFTIYIDKSLNPLRRVLFVGTHITNIQFDMRKAGNSQLYEQVYMENVVVTSITGGLDGASDRGTINVSFCPAKFRYTYYITAPNGTQTTNLFGWDVQGNITW